MWLVEPTCNGVMSILWAPPTSPSFLARHHIVGLEGGAVDGVEVHPIGEVRAKQRGERAELLVSKQLGEQSSVLR